MKFTFGICAAEDRFLPAIIRSIEAEVPESDREILLIGAKASGAITIPFDESKKPGWITRKKNLIASEASNPIIVVMHDYVRLLPGWYESYESFGDDWDVCTNVVRKQDGTRAFDWFAIDYKQWLGPNLVDYSVPDIRGHMYPAGNYFLAKTEFLRANPLDESLVWGQNEDLKWMKGVCHRWNYRFNRGAEVQYMRPHHHSPNYSVLITKP
jgi:hypothetical protein